MRKILIPLASFLLFTTICAAQKKPVKPLAAKEMETNSDVDYPSVSTFFCWGVKNDDNSTNYEGFFDYLNSKAINDDNVFYHVSRFDNFRTGNYIVQTKVIDSKGEQLASSNKLAFYINKDFDYYTLRNKWTIAFKTAGVFKFITYVNDSPIKITRLKVGID